MQIEDIPHEELTPIYVSPQSPVDADAVHGLEMILEFAPASEYREMLIEMYNLYVMQFYPTFQKDFTGMAEKMILLQSFFKDRGGK